MEASQPVIIIEKKDEEQKITHKPEEEPTMFDLIKTLIILYFIIGVICYFFSPKWFETLYKKPYDYIISLAKVKN